MHPELKNRVKMVRDKHYRAACHEAAHAVVCLKLGQTFKCIWLRKEGREVPDYIRLGTSKSMGRIVPTDETIYREDAPAEAAILMAGIVFEKLVRPHSSYFAHCMGQTDFEGAVKMARYAMYGCADDKQVDIFLFKMQAPALRKRLIEHWNEIVAVGEVLLQRGELSQAETEAVLGWKQQSPSVAPGLGDAGVGLD